MSQIPVVTLQLLMKSPMLFNSLFERQVARMQDTELKAKNLVEEFKHGEFFISIAAGLVIFGEVDMSAPVPPDQLTLESLDQEDRDQLLEEYEHERESFFSLIESGYLFGNCFSVMCPEGEMGSTHITMVAAKIDKATFDRAKVNGWRHLGVVN